MKHRPRRTELTTPGHSLEMIQKACASAADLVICDLEDACAMSQKTAARAVVARALATLDWGSKPRVFRANGVVTSLFKHDLEEVIEGARGAVDAVVIPKIRSIDEVRDADDYILHLEEQYEIPTGSIGLELLIETADAVENAVAIAKSSPRIESLIFGVADYAADIGASFDPADMWTDLLYPRQRIVNAARSAGIQAIDAVSFLFKNNDLTKTDAERARKLGFDGKWVVHPAQIAIVNTAFTPSEAEIARAKKIIEAWRSAGERGLGAVAMDNEMIDLASVRVCERVLERAGEYEDLR
ncbi:MAG: CoA ester lyase [Planctomycetes bacterium]|nr:CoA ester lyase [Planctomycetota bacterium]